MAHSLDPANSSITYKVEELAPNSFRFRRRAINGSQMFVRTVLDDNREWLDLMATALAAHEGGTIV